MELSFPHTVNLLLYIVICIQVEHGQNGHLSPVVPTMLFTIIPISVTPLDGSL